MALKFDAVLSFRKAAQDKTISITVSVALCQKKRKSLSAGAFTFSDIGTARQRIVSHYKVNL
jgi:hypothetical protein